MMIPHCKPNEAGPVAAESGFAGVTKLRSNATFADYSQNSCRGKQNALTVETPAGRIAIGARQPRRALAALISAGSKGVTALELSSWAYRLGAYVHTLRHDYGLEIETLREPHDGGWHGRYVLHTPCQIIGGAA
ncbi:hypothetical protein [Sphingorhabdus sp.]|uniref:winged helix domain-containing protein n=1 Tax=Sphingorhabdus sp. TaxID=1902408 RepID=UPI00398321E4